MCLENCLIKAQNVKDFPVYIDGSNVAYFGHNKIEPPRLSEILLLLNYLIDDLSFKKERIQCICDPSLKYYIDNPLEYEVLIKEKLIIEAPKYADEFILSFALKHAFCFIISNDRFKEYINQLPSRDWLEMRLISFMIIGEQVCLSPNIDYEKLQKKTYRSKNPIMKSSPITTIDILNRIKESEGKLDLF